ncbi:restriction endonuclease subunit S [Deinococcus sp. UR1]|uniref:restriction endonuclease subunit S n=1 Tax=Deinococcus sp. UR1 TaxID=1704277 RepID=UPI000A42D66B|nr:restriction endonuclease subunit S [Deinococcus sp. UR1]PIG97172.1 hypothetical protein AMD26_014250 [Deinococcus sp. UR1]
MSKSRFAPGIYKVSELIDLKILDIGDGYRAKNSEMSEEGLPFARAGNINEGFHFESADRLGDDGVAKAAEKISRPGDVLFTSKGTVGRFALVREDTPQFVYSPQLCYWRSKEHSIIYPKFLYYWMSGPGLISQINSVKGQTDMADYVNLRDQRMMYIQVPPIATQREIAAVLSSLDDKGELNRQMNRTLEQMARALFKSWFIDFDPVHAKQRGEQPAGMDAETAALFPDRFVEIDGKEVPEGWEIAKLGKLIDLDKGVSYKGEFLSQSGIPMLNLGTFFAKAGFKPSGIKYYTGDYKNKHTVEAGDIIIANTDLTQRREIIGSPAIVPKGIGSGDIIFTHHTFAMRNRGLAGQQFIYHIMQTDDYRERVIGHAHGTTVLAVKKDSLLDLEIILPSGEIVDRFCIQASALYNCAEQNGIEIAHLTQVRDSLLPRLLSGELDVSDWENAVEGL